MDRYMRLVWLAYAAGCPGVSGSRVGSSAPGHLSAKGGEAVSQPELDGLPDSFAERSARHTCHAFKCESWVPPKMFMCKKHWYMVPKALRNLVWRFYEPGQEIRMDLSPEYLETVAEAIRVVAKKEGLR